jgi:hypothetical protein
LFWRALWHGFMLVIHIVLLESYCFKMPCNKIVRNMFFFLFLQFFKKFESFRFYHANDITTWLKCATTPSFCVKYNYACWMLSPLGQCIPKWHKCWNMNGNNVIYAIHMIHVWHKIIHNRSSSRKENFSLTFVEIVENWTQSFNHWIIPTNTKCRCTLHAYSSIVEILENWFWSCWTLFFLSK